jgi:hypothetical protein
MAGLLQVGAMGRRYAAVLGLLAFATMLARGIADGGAWNAVLGPAIAALVVFATLGGTAGWLAEQMIDDDIRRRLSAELAARSASNAKPPKSQAAAQRK